MQILSVNNLALHFGVVEIFNNVNFQVQDNAKIGLVGSNGAGKTSLLKIIAKINDSTSGTLSYKNGIKVNYLSQISNFTCDNTVFNQVMSVFDDIYAIEQKKQDIEHQMADANKATLEKLSDEYHQLTEEFDNAGGYAIERQARSVLAGLNIGEDMYDRKISSLSGGQRARISLASALLRKPSLLLLDEPTNHLDMEAIDFLENYLKFYSAAYIIVSHDRYFLDKICNQIYEMSLGTLTTYTGNYSEFITKRDERYNQLLKEYNANQDYIKQEQAIIARYRKWGRAKSLKSAKSREKRLDKVDRLEKPKSENTVRFRFRAASRSGDDVIVCENIGKSFDDVNIFSDINLHIKSGEKIAILGANGIGKTTLLKLFTKEHAPSKGNFLLGTGVTIGYYDQHQQNLSLNKCAIDEIWDTYRELTHQQIRDTLALFLFRGDDIEKEISYLSGGERSRLSLLKLMLSEANFIILDEPTNHLDMDSREVLEAALADFPGTVLFVSHDRYFINNIATRILYMERDSMTSYPGNWNDYLMHLSVQRKNQEQINTQSKTERAKEFKQKRQIQSAQKDKKQKQQALESEIESLEASIKGIEQKLADTTNLSSKEINELSKEYSALSKDLEESIETWSEISI